MFSAKNSVGVPMHLKQGRLKKQFLKGAEIYAREGFCITCHQADGKGLPTAGLPTAWFSPLAGSKWATGDEHV